MWKTIALEIPFALEETCLKSICETVGVQRNCVKPLAALDYQFLTFVTMCGEVKIDVAKSSISICVISRVVTTL